MKNDEQIPREQLELIERFIAAYNTIDSYLRKHYDEKRDTPFSYMAQKFAKENRIIPGISDLAALGDLRNSIVHGKTEPYRYLSVPLPSVVERIEQLCEYLYRPPRIFDKVARGVQVLKESDRLTVVLGLIRNKSFSQFPVYDGPEFKGLLTENGIVRWLARHMLEEMTLVELADFDVKMVLRQEEKRRNCGFTCKDTPVFQVLDRFAENSELEAIIVTHSGGANDKPLGIVTRWDVARLGSSD